MPQDAVMDLSTGLVLYVNNFYQWRSPFMNCIAEYLGEVLAYNKDASIYLIINKENKY